jgi:hypothetical protein
MAAAPLFLSHDADYDWLTAIEFGQTDDMQPPENWEGVSDSFGWLRRGPEGEHMGFIVKDFSTFEPDADEVSAIWDGPRFDVPDAGATPRDGRSDRDGRRAVP